jgi:hypothetical protein
MHGIGKEEHRPRHHWTIVDAYTAYTITSNIWSRGVNDTSHVDVWDLSTPKTSSAQM